MELDISKREDLINPVIIWGTGCCPKCYGPLTVMDMETTFMQLNKFGNPISEDCVIRCEGICRACGERVPMLRKGLGYIQDNEYTRLERWYENLVYEREVHERMESLKPPKDNPFMINMGG